MLYQFRRRLYHLIPKLNVEYVYTHNLKNVSQKDCRIPVEVFKLSLKNIHRIVEVKKIPLDKLRKRLERGDFCYVTQVEGKLISYHWVQFTGTHFIQQAGRSIEVEPGDFWIYHTRVSEKFRGNGINGKVLSDLILEAKRNNHQQALIYTNKNNISNRKGLEKLGFKLRDVIYSYEMNRKFHQVYKKKIT
ncbi:GNAT family N-acetyltransferase [Mesonia ostreae]|uniref:GNAT family N-acetyltransferase n=1 Tax=Mesonia ostreae TaxID=861110 RepID=A0ABU2KMB2_9FLAO|nr:GNAT family N-acetyltransferase [Mesonia ostreae]MDT0295764.1 GNAT family N-acetyltransferase [Mesonia ostreae]